MKKATRSEEQSRLCKADYSTGSATPIANKSLAAGKAFGYSIGLAANSAISFDRLKSKRRTSVAQHSRRFFVPAVCYGGCVWGVLALAGFLFDRSVNLHITATQSFDSDRGSPEIQKGATQ